MIENQNDQRGQESSSGQSQNQGSQQNQGNQCRDESTSTNCTTGDDKCDVPEQDKTPLPDSEISNKTYSGIANLDQDSQKDPCSHQGKNGNHQHIENQYYQGEQKPTGQEQNLGGQQYQGNQSSEDNHSFQGSKTTGQIKFQIGQQGEQNRDQYSSLNTLNDDDQNESQQNEISQAERERSTTTPYGRNSTESNPDNQDSDSDTDDSLIDNSNFS